MLTRLEVRGFKNLLDTHAEFGPFTCIAGANGIGKSNVFDAIEFLSHLSSETIVEASQRVRGITGIRGSDARDLFWDGYREHERRIDLAAEMLVPAEVEDDLGAPARPTSTFLRYEISLGYEPPQDDGFPGRPVLLREELRHINKGDAARHLRFPHRAGTFRDAVVVGRRRSHAYMDTDERTGETFVTVHADAGGQPQRRAVDRAGRTVLSTAATNDHPTVLAARREMQSWRRFALEPSALREPDGLEVPRSLGDNGQHLAATLYRIAHDATNPDNPDPDALFARIAGRLSDLTGVRIEGIDVDLNRAREVFTLFLLERDGLRLPARALSEGTLRFLALCVLLEDPTFTGLLCMEEPENGIHPANLPAVIELIRDLAVDPALEPDRSNPFRQVIVNTHAPGVVQLCDPADLLLAELVTQPSPDGGHARALTLLPYRDSWRAAGAGRTFSEADVVAYITPQPGAQLRLPMDLAG